LKYLLICFAFVSCLHAQNAQVAGFVRDQSSADVPDAKVQIKNVDTGVERSSVTSQDGLYAIPELLPGRYTVTVQHEGFQTVVREGIILEVAQNARIDFTLQVGATQQAVTVQGDAPMINTTDASVSTVVDREFVENMPLNGRTFQSLIALTPGTVITPVAEDLGQFSVAGQRAGSNYFSVDGVGANFAVSNGPYQGQTSNGGIPALSSVGSTASLVSLDAVQEFRLQSAAYSPEYGREAGGQITLVTRSGTNLFHGTVFDYFRNDVLDANDWFADSVGLAKPRERQNDFGGVFGGPIKKNKTFFFFSYEGLRVSQPQVGFFDVPSLEARANAPASIKALVDAYPLPNGPASGVDQAQLAASASGTSTLDATSLRIDHSLTSNVTLFGRFNYSPSQTISPTGSPNTNYTNNQKIITGTLGLTAILTPTITNDLRFNYSEARGDLGYNPTNYGGAVVPPNNAIFSPYQSPNNDLSIYYVASGRNVGTTEGAGSQTHNVNRQTNIVDSLSYLKGTHQLKFGVDYRRLTPVEQLFSTFSFTYWLEMSSFVTGAPPDYSVLWEDQGPIHLRFQNVSGFAQDTWKATSRLTLTYGVRWDYNPPPAITSGNAPYVLSETTNLATATLLPRGTPLWHADWKNFAPRFGASYQLTQSAVRPTVLRFGIGQFYDLGTSTSGYLDNGEGRFPYSTTNILCSFGTGPACNDTVPFQGSKPPLVFTPPYDPMAAFAPHLKLPYALEWNVALEQALSRNQTFKITYLGSADRRLLRSDLLNTPNPLFSGLFLTTNKGYSNYDALQLQFERRLSHGLQALVSYAWSHSLDLNSADVSGTFGVQTATVPSNLFNIRQDYGDSNFDIRHSFSAALSYNIPAANIGNSFVRSALRDWSIDSINSARTGLPFNVLYTPATPGAFTGPDGPFALRPDQVSGQPVYLNNPTAPGGKELNPAAFTIPSVLQQGSEGRNTIRGFPLVQLDLAIRRQFSITEHLKLQFRADGFNFINHPNFGNPLSNLGTCALGAPCTPVFGWGTSQGMLNSSLGAGANGYGSPLGSLYQIGGPRSFQLSMKLQF
jgi:hypothetical protein